MPQHYRHQRSADPATAFPVAIQPGEIIVNTANRQLAVGDADSASLGATLQLLAVRIFDAHAQYAAGDFVVQAGALYRAKATISPGAFTASQWVQYADKTYVDNAIGSLVSDASAVTFTPVGNVAATDVQDAIAEVDSEKVAKTGDTMIGHLTLPTSPAAANAVRKDYVDAADAVVTTAFQNADTALQTAKADKTYVDNADALKAPLASPTFTGDPKAPTPTAGDNDTSIATTQFVTAAVTAGVASVPAAPVAATAAEYISNSAPTKMLTPGAAWSAVTQVPINDTQAAAGIDLNTGLDFVWTIGGAGKTIANPQNATRTGQKGVIILVQGVASATITTWGSKFLFPGATKPVLSTAVNSIDIISYVVGGSGAMFCSFSAGFG